MKVIHVLRKPLSEGTVAKNVLKHGTGALNIDKSRISTGDNLNGGAYAENASDRPDGSQSWRYKRGDKGNAGEFEQPDGRWPANVILQHKPGCRCVGVKRVKGITGGSNPVRRSGVHAEAKGHQTIGRSQSYSDFAGEDGKETVAHWACEPGCPVSALDEQSGVRPSTGPHPSSATVYDDTGGASRFYKQVGGNHEP